MKTVFVSILLALAIVLGGSGATAYAAQDSIPTDILYPVKLFLEDAQYSLTTDPIEKVELLVTFANTRIAEIAALAEEGEEIPVEVTDDLQNELQTMLILAAGLDETNTTSVLLHIRDNLRIQDQDMTNQPDGVELAMHVLQNHNRVAELGLEDPLKFRQMFGYHKTDDTEDPVDPDPEVPPDDPYPEPEPSEEPNGDCPNPGDCVPIGDGPFPQGKPETGNDDNENGNNGDDNGNNGGDNGNDGGQSGNGGGVNVGGYYVTVNGSLYYYANGNYTYVGNGQNGGGNGNGNGGGGGGGGGN